MNSIPSVKKAGLILLNDESKQKLSKLIEFYTPHLLNEYTIEECYTKWLEVCFIHIAPQIWKKDTDLIQFRTYMAQYIEQITSIETTWNWSTGKSFKVAGGHWELLVRTTITDNKLMLYYKSGKKSNHGDLYSISDLSTPTTAAMLIEEYNIVKDCIEYHNNDIEIDKYSNDHIWLKLNGNHNNKDFVKFITETDETE